MPAVMVDDTEAGTYQYGNGLYAVSDLRRVFDAVSDPNDWKGPIAVSVPGELVNAVCAAILYYTATNPGVDLDVQHMTYIITSPGYRRGPAGD